MRSGDKVHIYTINIVIYVNVCVREVKNIKMKNIKKEVLY